MKDLNALSNQELEEFFDSFDLIVSDVHGVLWNFTEPIPNTAETIKCLKKIGKQVFFLSNNTISPVSDIIEKFEKLNFDVKPNDIVLPIPGLISYLRKQKIADKKVFVIGMTHLKQSLKDAGFKLAENAPDRIKETMSDYINNTAPDDEDVAAVIYDVDLNVNYVNLQRATTYLRRSEVLFLRGVCDGKFPISKERFMFGPGCFLKILEDASGRKAMPWAKPGVFFSDHLMEQAKIKDPKRVLFVGDSVPEDMGIATIGGYKKLLVLSGLTARDDLEKWTFPEEYKPDFFVENLGLLHGMMARIPKFKNILE